MESMILKPQPLGLFNSTNTLEPQMVQCRTPNTSYLLLDSEDSSTEKNKVSMLISSIKTRGEQGNTLISGISRLLIRSFGINYVTSNVNPTNNNVIFYSSNTGLTPYSFDIPAQFYTTSNALITEIVNQMNTFTGLSGLTFSFTANLLCDDLYNLNSVGGNYYFSNTTSAAKYGFNLYNLPLEQVFTNTKVVGNMGLAYTRYIDVCSNTIGKHMKCRNISTNSSSNIIFRFYLDTYTKAGIQSASQVNMPCYNFHVHDPITIIDLELRDEFGNLLYVPNINNQIGFRWTMSILLEI